MTQRPRGSYCRRRVRGRREARTACTAGGAVGLALGVAALLALGGCGRAPVALAGDAGASDTEAPAAADLAGEAAADGARPDTAPWPPDLGLPDAAPRADGAGPLPDLRVKLSAAVKDTTVTYEVVACNFGAAAAGASTVGVYDDRQAAPQPGDPPDRTRPLGALAPGQCAQVTLVHEGAPAGPHAAWAVVDPDHAVAESDELNNVAGPVPLTVTPPHGPDLMIQTFDAQVSGATITYTVEVCNQGTAGAYLFRVDIYYKRVLKPTPLMVGDTSALILALSAGSCRTVTRTYSDAPVGLYSSWAQADTLGTVKELDESNNTAGPKMVTVKAPLSCSALCPFATTCGLFTALEGKLCLSWCNALDPAERQCAMDALKKLSCSDLKACNLPPKPPPPPPPWACLDLCRYLVDDCQLIPKDQYLTCLAGCATLPSTKVQCGLTAKQNQQCLQVMLCIF